MKKAKKYEGKIEPLRDKKPFYMVVLEGSYNAPKVKHENYEQAFNEALRLSKSENNNAYVLISVSLIEQVPNIIHYE